MKHLKKQAMQGLATVSASVLVLSMGVETLANSRAQFINGRLGTTNYQVIQTDSESDGIYYKSEFNSLEEVLNAKKELATQLSAEGSVLLKNDGALPVKKDSENITLWGLNSINPTLGGMIGSSVAVDEENGQTAYSLQQALEEKQFTLNQTMLDLYSSEEVNGTYGRAGGHSSMPSFGMTYENTPMYKVGEAPASVYTDEALKSADDTAAVVVLSRDSSEATDYNPNMVSGDESDSFERPLALSDNEKAMIELAKAHSTKVIVLINSDNPMELGDLENDAEIDAILWVGEPGMNGFLGVADVLCGDANPSGHLSDTYPANTASSPSMVNWGVYLYTNSTQAGKDAVLTEANKADWYLVESEGIYSGYKYYETRYEDQILGQGNADTKEGSSTGDGWDYANEMVYPFGYGLSYTTFEQKLKSVDVAIGGEGTAVVDVTNTGDVAGSSAVELYVQAPYTEGGIEKAAVQLLDFGKTKVLEPGETETVTITFDPQYMASYDEDAVKENGTQGAWVLDAGDYYFAVGNGAHEALNNILAKKTGSTDNLIAINEDENITADNAIVWNLGEKNQETYSVGVENALQDADINNFIENTVEYTTRSDWSKGWTPVEAITPTEEMMVGLTNNTYSLTENSDYNEVWGADNGLQLADFILTDENGNTTGVLAYDDPQWDQLLDQVTLDEAINFVEAGGDDFENIDSIGYPRTYANDGPIGFVRDQVPGYFVKWNKTNSDEPTYVAEEDEYSGYGMAGMPTEPVVAATFNKELVQREGEIFGEDSLWSNIASILGPGLNNHRTPYCGRNHEYYSEDSMLTNLMGVAVCTGGTSKGLMMTPKHFAFNNMELNRSGLSTFMTEQAGREMELRGFQGAMQKNVAKGIMTAFNRVGTVFAGADEGVQTQIARNEWGYTGWIVTDMINGADYMNWKDSLLGGGRTMLSNPTTYEDTEWGAMTSDKNMKKIKADSLFQHKMKEILKTYVYTTAQSNAMNGISAGTQIVYVNTWWQNLIVGIKYAFGALTVILVVLYLVSLKKNGKEKE